jgi:hypothetical protein
MRIVRSFYIGNNFDTIGRNPDDTFAILNTLNSITKRSLTVILTRDSKWVGILEFLIFEI